MRLRDVLESPQDPAAMYVLVVDSDSNSPAELTGQLTISVAGNIPSTTHTVRLVDGALHISAGVEPADFHATRDALSALGHDIPASALPRR